MAARTHIKMFGFNTIAIVLYVFSVSVSSDSDYAAKGCGVRMRTDAGWVCGRVRAAEDGTKYASFRGIPYGKAPLGERRFKELEPLEPWDDIRDATEDGPACPQKDILCSRLTLNKKGMSEDCIHLNVHVPYSRLPQNETSVIPPGLPILVMIHGGGFNAGSGLTDLHGPEYLMTKYVIVITFNYRINVFGFLSLGSRQVPGNQGLRDQVTLLRWVRRNARAFGGDPDDVTLMGQSAGASSAHILTMSRAAEGLFKKVILMSGTGIPNYFTTSQKHAKEIASTFLSVLGINCTDPEVIHQQLVKLPLVNIMHANILVQHKYGLLSFAPVVEDEYLGVTRILDDTPLELIAKGRGKKYPFLIGFTNVESEFFRWICVNTDMIRRLKENPKLLLSPRLLYNMREDQIPIATQKANDKCFNGTHTLDKFLKYLDYSFFKYPAFKLAEWRAMHAPVYLYKYSYKSERSLIKEALWSVYEGATHVEDLTYVFKVNSMLGDYVAFPPKNNDDRMKERMTSMITNFMRCSKPICNEDESAWPQYSGDRAQYQNIDEPSVFHMSGLTAEEMDMVSFLDSIDYECRNVNNRIK